MITHRSRAFAHVFTFVSIAGLLWTPCWAQKTIIHNAEQPHSPEEAAATMRVPEGVRVTLFAGEPDVMQPIGFCLDDRGRLWVAEAYNYPEHGTKAGDRIVILEDSDGDGRHDQRTVFYEGLNYVSGIEVGFGGVWVMSPPFFYFIPDRNADDVPDESPQLLLDGFGNHANAHNMANALAWGPDGWLYGTHGRTNWSMVGTPGTPDDQRERFDGGVYRYHPTQHVWEPFADGTTNPWGIDWNDVGDAFICNCVNPHLFQVIQGAHYEPWRGRQSSQYAYQRIDTIADHFHYVGLGNVRNGIGSADEDAAGGGHAHCGTMIYLGDHFPSSYRNQLFTNNIHGRRVNNDLLRRSGSGYVASHGADLMRSDDPWFMGVTLTYGPSGEIYVSDWSDTGECHSTRNTRKSTGRVFRLTYLANKLDPVDLSKRDSQELVELQLHDNDWMVRHARRILQERAYSGQSMLAVHERLWEIVSDELPVRKRLRALWALRVTQGLSPQSLLAFLNDPGEEIRVWAIRFSCENGQPNAGLLTKLKEMAADDLSAKVRLELASALQRIPRSSRWPIAETLASHGEDAQDQNLPLMIWYGVEPLIDDDLVRYVGIAVESAIPRVRENIARRIASAPDAVTGMELLLGRIAEDAKEGTHRDLIAGLLLGLEGQRTVKMPDHWPAAYRRLQQTNNDEVRDRSIQLAMRFQDRNAIESLQRIASDPTAATGRRQRVIAALVEGQTPGFADRLLELIDDRSVRADVLRGLSHYDHGEISKAILDRYSAFTPDEKRVAIQTLASRIPWAIHLLDALESGEIVKADLDALAARQLRSLNNQKINSRLKEVWGEIRETPKQKSRQIAVLREMLSSENLRDADHSRGRELFVKRCASCHRFFGEGGAIGPDITGAQRTNLDYLLENIVDPSASVAKEFQMRIVRTIDGRVITGLVESKSDRSITIVNANDRFTLPLEEVEEEKQSSESVMPSGLLEGLDDRQIRDLFGYLQR